MPPVGIEPKILAGERPKTYALDRATTGTGIEDVSKINFHIQFDAENKCGVPTKFLSASVDKGILKLFFHTYCVVIVGAAAARHH